MQAFTAHVYRNKAPTLYYAATDTKRESLACKNDKYTGCCHLAIRLCEAMHLALVVDQYVWEKHSHSNKTF